MIISERGTRGDNYGTTAAARLLTAGPLLELGRRPQRAQLRGRRPGVLYARRGQCAQLLVSLGEPARQEERLRLAPLELGAQEALDPCGCIRLLPLLLVQLLGLGLGLGLGIG